MKNLLELPSECLLHILRFLQPQQIEVFARTFNRKILSLCLPLLASRIKKARNKRRMRTIFGSGYPMTVEEEDFDLAGLDEEYSLPDIPFDHFQFLELNGSLDWLVPPEDEAGKSGSTTNSITSTELDKFRSVVRALGLEKPVPDVFWKLGVDDNVHALIPTVDETHFSLGGICRIDLADLRKLSKARTEMRNDSPAQEQGVYPRKDAGDVFAERNYAFTFCEDLMDERYWNLFLDTNGGHCVLESSGPMAHGPRHRFLDPEDEVGSTIRSGIDDELDVNKIRDLPYTEVEDLVLSATDLEEWLVNLNYAERTKLFFFDGVLARGTVEPGRAKILIDDIKHFLRFVYTKEGREEQLH